MFDRLGRLNCALFLFLDEPRARDLFPAWDLITVDTVATLRIEAGLHPDDPDLTELIGQLATRSTEFRKRWATNDVRTARAGSKTFRHPLIGEITLPYETLRIDAASSQIISVYTPNPAPPKPTPSASSPAGTPTTNETTTQQREHPGGTTTDRIASQRGPRSLRKLDQASNHTTRRPLSSPCRAAAVFRRGLFLPYSIRGRPSGEIRDLPRGASDGTATPGFCVQAWSSSLRRRG